MNRILNSIAVTVIVLVCMTANVKGQPGTMEIMNEIKKVGAQFESLSHRLDVLEKKIDDIYWFERVGDVAWIDKVQITGPPPAKEVDPTGQGAGNPLKIWAYVFIPKNADPSKKYPLLVFPHGGVHANFDTYYIHIMREIVSQGYIVVAAEYKVPQVMGLECTGRSITEVLKFRMLRQAASIWLITMISSTITVSEHWLESWWSDNTDEYIRLPC